MKMSNNKSTKYIDENNVWQFLMSVFPLPDTTKSYMSNINLFFHVILLYVSTFLYKCWKIFLKSLMNWFSYRSLTYPAYLPSL
jgi:hypothetical protein